MVERGVCDFTVKLAAVEAAGGYVAAVVINREGSDACNQSLGMSIAGAIPAFGVVPREQGFAIFDQPGYNDAACNAGDGSVVSKITVGKAGDTLSFTSKFDGWGYVHLYKNGTGKMTELDTYAIPEAHDPAFAVGKGDLSVHEVATSKVNPKRAYLSYYAGVSWTSRRASSWRRAPSSRPRTAATCGASRSSATVGVSSSPRATATAACASMSTGPGRRSPSGRRPRGNATSLRRRRGLSIGGGHAPRDAQAPRGGHAEVPAGPRADRDSGGRGPAGGGRRPSHIATLRRRRAACASRPPAAAAHGRLTSRTPVELPVKTYVANSENRQRNWLVVDAEGQTLGRLATQIADALRGKRKPEYTPHVDTGDFVVVINAEKISVTGSKRTEKRYYRHSGYPGGIRSRTLEEMLDRRPEEVIRKAVKGMLPRNRLARKQITKLKVYAGPEHPHAAQMPVPMELAH